MNKLSERLKELRAERKESQDILAELLNVSRTSYCKYETERHDPSIESLYILAEHFDVTIDYLLGRTDERNYPRRIDEKEETMLHGFRVTDESGKEFLLSHINEINKYNLEEDEEKLLLNYRVSSKNGKIAISEFVEYIANKTKRKHKYEE